MDSIELNYKEVKEVQKGLGDLAALSSDKKTKMSFAMKIKIRNWLSETERPYKNYIEEIDTVNEELGEEIFTKDTVISQNVVVKNYDDTGAEKLVSTGRFNMPRKDGVRKQYDSRVKLIENEMVELMRVERFTEEELEKLNIDVETLYSLEPITAGYERKEEEKEE